MVNSVRRSLEPTTRLLRHVVLERVSETVGPLRTAPTRRGLSLGPLAVTTTPETADDAGGLSPGDGNMVTRGHGEMVTW